MNGNFCWNAFNILHKTVPVTRMVFRSVETNIRYPIPVEFDLCKNGFPPQKFTAKSFLLKFCSSQNPKKSKNGNILACKF